MDDTILHSHRNGGNDSSYEDDDLPHDLAVFQAMEKFLSSDIAQSLFSHLIQNAVMAALSPLKNELDNLKSETN